MFSLKNKKIFCGYPLLSGAVFDIMISEPCGQLYMLRISSLRRCVRTLESDGGSSGSHGSNKRYLSIIVNPCHAELRCHTYF